MTDCSARKRYDSEQHARADARDLMRTVEPRRRYEAIACACGFWHVRRRRRGKKAREA